MKELTIKTLTVKDLPEIVKLTKFLNPEMDLDLLLQRQAEMFSFQNHICLGCYRGDALVALSSGWITVRLYSGKQLEIDNVIVNPDKQGKGVGAVFLNQIEAWARENHCLSVELNAYVDNDRAHKFYFREQYKILGFHFRKLLSKGSKTETSHGCFTGSTDSF